jgi:hypothetical protein
MELNLSPCWLTFPVMASINTRIGWPGLYWEASFLAFAGYLLVLLVIVISFAVLFRLSNPAPLISSFALLACGCVHSPVLASIGEWFSVSSLFWLYSGFSDDIVLAWLAWTHDVRNLCSS